VSDTTLAFDLEVKVPLYARAGIREVWVVDLAAQAIISFRKPVDGRYTEEVRYGPGELLRPGAFPDFALDPATLFD
jgi:Uma2 family endonuclease